MTFLNPAILFGLLAASIPVLIHLLNLRKLKKIDFSTLKFLKELQKNKIKRIKLKQWLLLALRVFIILLLVTAFARPTLEGVSIGGTTSAAKTSALFILDDTFSMSVVDQNGSYFNQAKQSIKKILSQLEEGDEVGTILVSDPKGEIEFTTNLSYFEESLNEISVSEVSNELNSSMIKAAEVISGSKNFNKEIYLLTDFQKNRLALEQNITDLGELIDEQVRLYSFNYSGKSIFNISVDELIVKTKIFELNKPVKFEAKITNHSSQDADNLVVSLFLNGKRAAQRSLDLKRGAAETVNLEAATSKTGFTSVYVEIEDDEVLQDNRRYSAFFIPDKIEVLLVSEIPDDVKFVELALLSSGSENFNVTKKSTTKLSTVPLNKFDVIIIIGTEVKDNSEKLNRFLKDGNGMIVFPGSRQKIEPMQKLLRLLELQTDFQFVEINDKSQSVGFENIEFNHPVFEDIFVDEEKREVESPKLFKYYKLQAGPKGKTIISLNDESSFMSEYGIGNGKLIIFNSSPVLSWSDFPLKSIFAPILNKTVYNLSPDLLGDDTYLAGDNLNVNIGKRTLPQVRVVLPDRGEELFNLNENLETDFFSFSNSIFSGNYKFYSGSNILANFSVNTDPMESKTGYLSDEEFDRYLEKINFGGTHLRIGKDEDPIELILQARFGSELWRYFILAALIIALIEMAVARNAKKEMVELSS